MARRMRTAFAVGLACVLSPAAGRAEARARVAIADFELAGRAAEVQECEGSACVKASGQKVEVKYVVGVRVEVAGNSYKTVARAFSTEGTAPAALPIATKSKTCDVCTLVEARETMLRLAD